ncbi:MAG: type VI secretion system-associated protein TagF [Methylococcaceae bacterium]|nr:type VI secretion system-associated protein TagF [Methylococcaceae bacterium]
MNGSSQSPGFYGKFPHLGDFVSRRLPRDFIDPWDRWLQTGLSVSREQLGDRWLDRYLISPIWRFALSPGLCGNAAWAGILMPSVDRVGRYYPLTIAAPVSPQTLPCLFLPHHGWFETLEQLALSGLDDEFDLDVFNSGLERTPAPLNSGLLRELIPPDAATNPRRAFQWGLHDLDQMPAVFADFNRYLLAQLMPAYSYWSTAGSEILGPTFLACEGLPPVDAYTALLTGDWSQRGWTVRVYAVAHPDGDETVPARAHVTRPLVEPARIQPRWLSAGRTTVGSRRKVNEDALLDRAEIGLWTVADGMGGHQAGDVASKAIVDALAVVAPAAELSAFQDSVAAALQNVNAALWKMAEASEQGEVIGSTVVVMLVAGNQCRFLWAGDSRLYRYRSGQLEQLTHDHSLFDDLVRQGIGNVDQLLEQGRCNVITRAVGADAELELEYGRCEAQVGDLYLLCSDGLDKELATADIAALCAHGDPEIVLEELIRMAEERGARDNVTAIVIRYAAG